MDIRSGRVKARLDAEGLSRFMAFFKLLREVFDADNLGSAPSDFFNDIVNLHNRQRQDITAD